MAANDRTPSADEQKGDKSSEKVSDLPEKNDESVTDEQVKGGRMSVVNKRPE
jgi:hypothetical protein